MEKRMTSGSPRKPRSESTSLALNLRRMRREVWQTMDVSPGSIGMGCSPHGGRSESLGIGLTCVALHPDNVQPARHPCLLNYELTGNPNAETRRGVLNQSKAGPRGPLRPALR